MSTAASTPVASTGCRSTPACGRVYADKQEPINRGPDDSAGGVDNPNFRDPDAAKKGADFKAAFNVVFYLGVSFYLPPKFEYVKPR
ncbi:MAG: hypothetical protein IPN32_24615 [Deltaproteobacteria bacterium]|nr:hypothetical protein [Deltaproteobacteria bacterium]